MKDFDLIGARGGPDASVSWFGGIQRGRPERPSPMPIPLCRTRTTGGEAPRYLTEGRTGNARPPRPTLVLRYPALAYQHKQPSRIHTGWHQRARSRSPTGNRFNRSSAPQRDRRCLLTERGHISVGHLPTPEGGGGEDMAYGVFLKWKVAEYELLRKEIEDLKEEVRE